MQPDDELATADNLCADVDRSLEVADWIADGLDGLTCPELPTDPKLGSALALHHLAIEHAQAILILVDHGKYGSALALIRPLSEAFVRGHWLQEVATPERAERAVDKDDFPDMKTLTRHLPGDLNGPDLAEKVDALNGYVHGGRLHTFGRLGEGGLGSHYGRTQVSSALLLADVFGLSAAWHIGKSLPGREKFTLECQERLRRIPLSPS